jgi:uronate dehydrogenase
MPQTLNRPKRLLLTGAAGEIGSVLRPALRGTADALRWHDLRPVDGAAAGEEVMIGDLTAPGVADAAMAGVDCVIHLAGIPRETGGTPEQILTANVIGTHNMFEAARKAGVKRFIFASSNHVIGFYRAEVPVGPDVLLRPDGHYGLSKVFGEGMGRLYADKHGMEVAALRIGAFRARPGNARELGGWISHRDMAQLARRCVEAPPYHFLVLYGVSANQRALWGGDDDARAHIGFKPEDNAEHWAAELEGKATPGGPIAALFHGGSVCALGFTGDPSRIT